MEELTISLALDGHGRTKYTDETEANATKRPKINEDVDCAINYSTRTSKTNIVELSDEVLDNLLFDAEICDCALLPRTFWVNAGDEPRCSLEKLALQVFGEHVPPGVRIDKENSGVEWWVQIRPSPPAGRYSMLGCGDDGGDETARSGITWHFDKDEDLRVMMDGSMWVHPHLSTVTYLTSIGAPTMVVEKRVDLSGQILNETSSVCGSVSWPRKGKHLVFDGRFLHAAPTDLLEEGAFDEQCKFDTPIDISEKERKVLMRRHRRVTLLVNIWLNYKPFNVNAFPDTMLDKLSKVDMLGDANLFDDSKSSKTCGKVVVVKDGKGTLACSDHVTQKDAAIALTKMSWPMGRDNETIEALMPLELIRNCDEGSDVIIEWENGLSLSASHA